MIQKIKDKGSFVFEGFKIVKNDTLKICPFCEQSILSSDGGYLQIIKNYQSIFDEEFIKLQNTTKEKLSDYKSSLQSINSNVEPQNNTSLLAKYKSLFDSDTEFEQFTLSDLEKEFITKEIKIVEDKLSDPLKPLNSDFTHELEKIFTRYNDFIIAYNKIVDELKNIIDAKQKELKKIDVKIEIKNSENENSIIDIQLYAISNMDKFKKIVRYEDALKKNENLIKTMEIILRKFREKVNNEFEVFISDYLSLIKKHIQNLYPNLDIVELEKSRGTTYDFRSNDVNCGFVVKYKGQDRFKALSEGEKQVIALAYFFAMVEKYQSKEEKIVVFDDPITSFDAGKRRQTAEYIYNQTYNFKQTFILTCDPLFRQYCQKFIPNQKSYYILKSSTSSILYTPKDIETIFNSFKKDLNEIDSIQGTDENIVEYGQKLRFCIEEIREKYLGHNTDSLSDVLNRVKGINFNDFQNKIDEILSIYNYCNVGGLAHYPKDGSTSWNELKNIVKKYQQLSL
ncbi:MAG: AAA family ATPase [Ignavibacterium sp.]|nr:AAA family ATPase [Ignavibacterium sp.]